MSLLSFLDNVFLRPFHLIYEQIFSTLLESTKSVGLSILLFGVLVNIALLPAYFQMERAGQAANQKRAEVDAEVARMKRHFKGRELYFYIRAVYRQHRYHPIFGVLGAFDLYVQILVFATVFRYLAAHRALHGASFLFMDDLSQPDAVLFGVHLLPLVMTLLNVLSAIAYAKDRRRRIQAFALAALFLAILYPSPSGMVLYWTCNNFVSLVRNSVLRVFSARIPETLRKAAMRILEQE